MGSRVVPVLVMETDPLSRDLIALALHRGGYSPIICQQPEELRAYLEKDPPRAVVMDTFQRGVNGLDLLAELREDNLLKDVPVVLVSSLAFSEIVVRAASLGAAAFLAKPLDTDLLLEQMKKVLGV